MKRKQAPLAAVLFLDIAVAAMVMLVFAYFLIGIPPQLMAKFAPTPKPEPTVTMAPLAAEASPAPKASTTPAPTPAPTEAPDLRTEWQKKFEEHFTEEVVIAENSYSSPNVSVTVEHITAENWRGQQYVYHVADIYISDISCFVTQTVNGELKPFHVADVENLDADADAILSMSGDFYCYQDYGFLMRNGEIYKDNSAFSDICVLFEDGRVGCYTRGEYTNEEILAQNPTQIWNFGPTLVDTEKDFVLEFYDAVSTIAMLNPRSALGYYEPGHYCFVVVDGRQDSSVGVTLPELAQIFAELGCTKAYNLDGGASAVLLFNHERASKQSNGASRALGDLLVIRESEAE